MLKRILVLILSLVILCSMGLMVACGEPQVSKNAQAVVDLINALPDTITGYSAGQIEKAEKAYADLTEQEKNEVANYSALQSVRTEYDSKYISVLSMTDLSLIEDFSYWFSGDKTDAEFTFVEDPEGKYGTLLRLEQKSTRQGALVIKYRTDAIDLSGCTKIVFTVLNGSGDYSSIDVKASGTFTGSDVMLGTGKWLVVEKDASTYQGIKQDSKTPKAGEGQLGIWRANQGYYFLTGIYAVKA